MKITSCVTACISIALAAGSTAAQTDKGPDVSKVFAKLTKTIEARTATKGDEFQLTTINDIVVNGSIAVPKGTRVMCHIGGVITKSKEEPKTTLAIFIDKAIVNEREIPLQGIIAAVAAPQESLTDDPAYSMMHSNEPKMVGSGTSGASSSGTLSPSSKSSSTAAVATAELKGTRDPGILLTENSQGAIGYEGVEISWLFTSTPPLTVFSSKAKNLKLEAGTQMLLRMVPPKAPK